MKKKKLVKMLSEQVSDALNDVPPAELESSHAVKMFNALRDIDDILFEEVETMSRKKRKTEKVPTPSEQEMKCSREYLTQFADHLAVHWPFSRDALQEVVESFLSRETLR